MIIFGVDLTPYMPFIYALLTGIAWAIYGWLTSTSNGDFSKIKFASTVLTSLLVVTIMWESGIPLTQAGWQEQMIAYAAFTVGLERLIQKVVDYFNKKPSVQAFVCKASGGVTPVEFTLTPMNPQVGDLVKFRDLQENVTLLSWGDGTLWKWDTGDEKWVATHQYKKAGTYTVTASTADKSYMDMPITVSGISPDPVPVPVTKKSWLEILIDWIAALITKIVG